MTDERWLMSLAVEAVYAVTTDGPDVLAMEGTLRHHGRMRDQGDVGSLRWLHDETSIRWSWIEGHGPPGFGAASGQSRRRQVWGAWQLRGYNGHASTEKPNKPSLTLRRGRLGVPRTVSGGRQRECWVVPPLRFSVRHCVCRHGADRQGARTMWPYSVGELKGVRLPGLLALEHAGDGGRHHDHNHPDDIVMVTEMTWLRASGGPSTAGLARVHPAKDMHDHADGWMADRADLIP